MTCPRSHRPIKTIDSASSIMPYGLPFDIVTAQKGWRDLRVVDGAERVLTTPPCSFSETRLVEVLEGVCSKSDFECHRLLELSEELVESWWFHK